MRLQVVTGHWRYHTFACLGKVSQFLESWRCDGSVPGHIALRFVIEDERDASVFNRMDSSVFGEHIFYKSGCDSVLFDINRTRPPTFHLVQSRPWSHRALTNMTVYEVKEADVAYDALQLCEQYVIGVRPYTYDDCAFATAFFPMCFQCCPMTLTRGHCVQLVLQILSAALYNSEHDLRNEMTYRGQCAGQCTRHPPYAAYSPAMAIVALQTLGVVEDGTTLHGESCVKFTFKRVQYR